MVIRVCPWKKTFPVPYAIEVIVGFWIVQNPINSLLVTLAQVKNFTSICTCAKGKCCNKCSRKEHL